ncbi:MAG: flippase-like domain-containing protein [Flavipsychrobacter sp.]|nr:flippase-like domain-containing protein [Flavipsychrobacter sp.]
MNKSTKIWINYATGGIVSVLLLAAIYKQVQKQLGDRGTSTLTDTGPNYFLVAAIVLMLANSFLESYKWFSLVRRSEPVSYGRALASYLAGIAFSIITPNRIGEYPGRILYLGRGSTMHYIGVSVTGVLSQLAAIWFLGLAGLVYYNIAFPDHLAQAALVVCVVINILLGFLYLNFDRWLSLLERIPWLRRFSVYGKLMGRMPVAEKWRILTISIVRVMVFTAQYLFLLTWMNVDVPIVAGFCLSALFFWVLAVVPSLALTELGVRGTVSLFIFGHFSVNTVGILAATTCLWLLNLVIPAVPGSILITKMKWLR